MNSLLHSITRLLCIALVVGLSSPAYAKKSKKPRRPTPPPPTKPTVVTPATPSLNPTTQNNTIAPTSVNAPITAVNAANVRLQSPTILQSFVRGDGTVPIAWIGSEAAVYVPRGVYQVIVEQQLASGNWRPFKSRLFKGEGGQITFTAPADTKPEQFRARAFMKNKFGTQGDSGTATSGAATPLASLPLSEAILRLDSIGVVNFANAGTVLTGNAVATTTTVATTNVTSTLKVDDKTPLGTESDIWKFAGDRLFYFNQLRGLQVIDIAQPAKPVKLGTLRMASVGDQIQVLTPDGSWLALMTRDQQWGWNARIHLVKVSAQGQPTLEKTIALTGSLGETRLIGSRLYIVLSGWDQALVANNAKFAALPANVRQSGAYFKIKGFDLSNPASPVELGETAGAGWQPQLQQAGHHLLVSTNYYVDNAYRTLVHAIDIGGDGKPELVKVVPLSGQMQDQFKMSIVGDAIVGVSNVAQRWEWNQNTWVDNGDGTFTVTQTHTLYPAKTWIDTFPLAGDSVVPLKQLHLEDAEGEQLHAVRFDGNRLYVVTFGVKQKGPKTFTQTWTWIRGRDPLFIIDLDDPANPVVRGQLDIPGWSTFMETLGDRLLSVGREDGKVAASLFDVSNPDAPTMLSRVYPGSPKENEWTWSESGYEHRAVTYLRDQNKFIVPYQTWQNTGYVTATQEINYTRSELTLGSVVSTKSTARRGTSIGGHLLTISNRELVVFTDTANADESKQVAWIELAWPVNQVVPMGQHLLQIESRDAPSNFSYSGWGNIISIGRLSLVGGDVAPRNKVVLRLSDRADPDVVLDSAELTGDDAFYLGSTLRGDTLYLAQLVRLATPELRTYALRVNGGRIHQDGAITTLLPADNLSTSGGLRFVDTQPLWVKGDQLVWFIPCSQPQPYESYSHYPSKPASQDGQIAVATTIMWWWGPSYTSQWGDSVAALLCPVSTKTAQPIASDIIRVPAARSQSLLLSASRAYQSNGWLFFSSTQHMTELPETDEAGATAGDYATNAGNRSTLLHALNFNLPLAIDELQPSALPGTLLGASNADEQGAWLLCAAKQDYETAQRLVSLAYDGVLARPVSRLDISVTPTNTDSRNGLLLVPSSGVTPYRQSQTTGEIETLTAWTHAQQPNRVRFAGDLIVSDGYRALGAAKLSAGDAIVPLANPTFADSSWSLMPARAAIASDQSGAWIPMGEFGVEWTSFSTTTP